MGIPHGLANALGVLGILLIVFAITDLVLANFFSIDITGVSWSPLAAGLLGGFLLRFFGSDGD